MGFVDDDNRVVKRVRFQGIIIGDNSPDTLACETVIIDEGIPGFNEVVNLGINPLLRITWQG